MQNTTVGIDSIIFALAIRHCAAWLIIHGPKRNLCNYISPGTV